MTEQRDHFHRLLDGVQRAKARRAAANDLWARVTSEAAAQIPRVHPLLQKLERETGWFLISLTDLGTDRAMKQFLEGPDLSPTDRRKAYRALTSRRRQLATAREKFEVHAATCERDQAVQDFEDAAQALVDFPAPDIACAVAKMRVVVDYGCPPGWDDKALRELEKHVENK